MTGKPIKIPMGYVNGFFDKNYPTRNFTSNAFFTGRYGELLSSKYFDVKKKAFTHKLKNWIDEHKDHYYKVNEEPCGANFLTAISINEGNFTTSKEIYVHLTYPHFRRDALSYTMPDIKPLVFIPARRALWGVLNHFLSQNHNSYYFNQFLGNKESI